MRLATVFLLWISALFSYGQTSSNHASDERAIRQLKVDVLKA